MMRPKTEDLDYNDSTVVVLYGTSGSGKTCFLASVLWHLRQRAVDYDLNVKNNPDGLALFNELIQHLARKIVPERTLGGAGYELDLRIKSGPINKTFTIVDIAGETSSFLQDSSSESEGKHPIDSTVSVEVNSILDKYLSIRSSDVVVLCFIDIFHEGFRADDQELGAENLLMHIKERYDHILKIGIVMTKIDKFSATKGAEDLTYRQMVKESKGHAKKHSLFYRMYKNPMNEFGGRIRIIPFAIGRVDEKSGEIIEHFGEGFESFMSFLGLDLKSPVRRDQILPPIVGILAFTLVLLAMKVQDGGSPTDILLAFFVSTIASILASWFK